MLAEKRGDRERALEAYGAAIDMIEKGYQTLGSLPAESRLPYLDRFRHVYAGYLGQAFEVMRRDPGRMRSLKGKSFENAQWAALTTTAAALTQMAARFAARDDSLASNLRDLQNLGRKLQVKERELPKGDVRNTEYQESLSELNALRAEQGELRARVEKDVPEYTALVNPQPVSIADLQGVLRPDEALVSFTVADDAVYLFAVRKGLAFARLARRQGSPLHRAATFRRGQGA
jgi:hypothetical protein